jgi:HPt (histidine-containing phosphotransfer) domain-containing protein/HAMP domain-containing protein
MTGGAGPVTRRLQSVALQLALATALPVLLAALGIYFALMRHERAALLDAKSRAAIMVSSLFAETLSPALVFEDEEAVAESLAYLKSNVEIDQAAVFGLDERGRAGASWGGFQRDAKQPQLTAPSHGDIGQLVARGAWLDAAQWVTDAAGKRIGIAVVRFSLAREEQRFAALSTRILQVAALIAIALTLLLLLLAKRYVISPLQALRGAVARLQGAQQLDGPELPRVLRSGNEVGELARAFVRMADVIQRREQAIAEQNREMRLVLESVGQGFLVLSADGRVVGQHSAIIDRWFGELTPDKPLWEQLAVHDPVQSEWLELTWSNIGAPAMPLDLCLEQLPKRLEASGKSFDLEYRPSCTPDGALERMVLIISDVSELVARERAEHEQRELAAVLTCIATDRAGFMSFFAEAQALVDRILAAEPSHQLLEDLHTLKGNAGLFQLRTLQALCERIETRLVAEGGGPNEREREELRQSVDNTRAVLARLTGHDELRELSLSASEYALLVQALERRAPHREVLTQLARATADPAERVFERLAMRLQLLARALGKCAVEVRMEGGGVRFPARHFDPLWAALVHALRNIADHALETTIERERAGKAPIAQVELCAELVDDKLLVRLRDDGRGVDFVRVRERAEALGLPVDSDEALLEALFAPGFSTARVGQELSGRGVGLSAIRSAVSALGGSVVMRSKARVGSELCIELPAQLVD